MLALLLAGCSEYGFPDPKAPQRIGPVSALPGQEKEDRILQTVLPVVDVLWVIDDSGSMSNNQATLIASFPEFIGHFVDSGLDYHIGVTRTTMILETEYDPYNMPDIVGGKLEQVGDLRWIDENTPDPEGTFRLLADVGVGGSAHEMGRGAAYYALSVHHDTYNAGFMRPRASMHTIVISDESDSTPDSVISLTEFIEWYGGLKQAPFEVTFSSIVRMFGASVGWNYLPITTAVGGVSKNIEEQGWDTVLEELGSEFTALSDEFFLAQLPVEETIAVTVEAGGVTFVFDRGDWDYNPSRNSIMFREFNPDPLSVVVIHYTLASSQ